MSTQAWKDVVAFARRRFLAERCMALAQQCQDGRHCGCLCTVRTVKSCVKIRRGEYPLHNKPACIYVCVNFTLPPDLQAQCKQDCHITILDTQIDLSTQNQWPHVDELEATLHDLVRGFYGIVFSDDGEPREKWSTEERTLQAKFHNATRYDNIRQTVVMFLMPLCPLNMLVEAMRGPTAEFLRTIGHGLTFKLIETHIQVHAH